MRQYIIRYPLVGWVGQPKELVIGIEALHEAYEGRWVDPSVIITDEQELWQLVGLLHPGEQPLQHLDRPVLCTPA